MESTNIITLIYVLHLFFLSENQDHSRVGAHMLSATAHHALLFVLMVPGSLCVVDRPTGFCLISQAESLFGPTRSCRCLTGHCS